LLEQIQDYSISVHRPVLGMKYPLSEKGTLKNFMSFVPLTRVIFVHRDLIDSLKSAKSRGFFKNEKQLEIMCKRWKANIETAKEIKNIWVVSYEDMIENQQDFILKLEKFCGITGVKPDVFDFKINAWAREVEKSEKADKNNNYILPSELSEKEMNIIKSVTES
jgi:hypothetical protein